MQNYPKDHTCIPWNPLYLLNHPEQYLPMNFLCQQMRMKPSRPRRRMRYRGVHVWTPHEEPICMQTLSQHHRCKHKAASQTLDPQPVPEGTGNPLQRVNKYKIIWPPPSSSPSPTPTTTSQTMDPASPVPSPSLPTPCEEPTFSGLDPRYPIEGTGASSEGRCAHAPLRSHDHLFPPIEFGPLNFEVPSVYLWACCDELRRMYTAFIANYYIYNNSGPETTVEDRTNYYERMVDHFYIPTNHDLFVVMNYLLKLGIEPARKQIAIIKPYLFTPPATQ